MTEDRVPEWLNAEGVDVTEVDRLLNESRDRVAGVFADHDRPDDWRLTTTDYHKADEVLDVIRAALGASEQPAPPLDCRDGHDFRLTRDFDGEPIRCSRCKCAEQPAPPLDVLYRLEQWAGMPPPRATAEQWKAWWDEGFDVRSEARTVAAEQPAPPLDVDRLGFYDLLDVAEAIMAKAYPPHPLLCSHDPAADIGARTTAAIADLIATCRGLGSAPSRSEPE